MIKAKPKKQPKNRSQISPTAVRPSDEMLDWIDRRRAPQKRTRAAEIEYSLELLKRLTEDTNGIVAVERLR